MAGYQQQETFQPPNIDVGAGRVGAALSDALTEFTQRAKQVVEPVLAQRAAIQGEAAGKERKGTIKTAFGPVGQAYNNAYIHAYTLGIYADTQEDFAKIEADSQNDPAKFMALAQARSKAIIEQVPKEIQPFIGDVLDRRTQEARMRIFAVKIKSDKEVARGEIARGIDALNGDISRGLTSGTIDGIEHAGELGNLLVNSVDSAVADGHISQAEGDKIKYESLKENASNVEIGNFERVLMNPKGQPEKFIEQFLHTDHPLLSDHEVQQAAVEMSRRLEQHKHLTEFGQASQRGALSDQLRDMEAAATQGLPVTATVQLHSSLLQSFGPVEGEQRFKHAQNLQTLSGVVGKMNAQPSSDIVSTVESYKPTKVEGAAEQTQLLGLVARQAGEILKARTDDPAGYLTQADPATATSWTALLASQGNPQARDVYLNALRAGKESLQISGSEVVPDSYVRSFAQAVSDPRSAESLSVTMAAEADRWGPAWPQVYQQMAKHVPDMALVIANLPPAAADMLAGTAALDNTQLASLLPSGVTMQDLSKDIGSAFEDVRRSFPADAGGTRTYNAMLDAAKRLAIVNMKTMSESNAVSFALKSLTANDNINEFRDGTYRVPKQFDAAAVDEGTRAVLDAYKPASNTIIREPGSHLSDEELQDRAQQDARNNGYFITNPAGDGVTFYLGGIPVRGPNGPLQFKFADLEQLGMARAASKIKLTPENILKHP